MSIPDKWPHHLYLTCPTCRVMSFEIVAVIPEVGTPAYEARCSGCNRRASAQSAGDGAAGDIQWANDLPQTPPAGTMAELTDITGYSSKVSTGNEELAKRRVLKHIEGWSKRDVLALAVGYSTDSESTVWVNFRSEEQRQWVLRKLGEITKTVENWDIGA